MSLKEEVEKYINKNSHRQTIPLCFRHKKELDTEQRRVHIHLLGKTIIHHTINDKVECILCTES